MVNDSKGLEDLIRQTYAKWEEEPENLNHYRQLSEYYQRYGDLENAIAWIQQARKQDAGKSDVSLEEKERALTLEYYDDIIDQWEKQYNEMPNDPEIKSSWEMQLKIERIIRRASLNLWCKGIPMISDIDMELG